MIKLFIHPVITVKAKYFKNMDVTLLPFQSHISPHMPKVCVPIFAAYGTQEFPPFGVRLTRQGTTHSFREYLAIVVSGRHLGLFPVVRPDR